MGITRKDSLVLFLIDSDPGIKSIFKLVMIFDRADFPGRVSKNLDNLLRNNLIVVNNNPNIYDSTLLGTEYLKANFNNEKTIKYIMSMQNPESLLSITEGYISKKNFSTI